MTSPLFPSLLLWASFLLLAACAPAEPAIFVSADGDDLNNGTEAQPFATLERAQAAAMDSFSRGNLQALTIWVEPGTYALTQPLVWDAAAFSPTGGQLFIKNRGSKPAVISGGKRLVDWHKSADGLWFAELPQEIGAGAVVRELFINGERAQRARFPNEGYLRVKEVGADKRTHFYFETGDFPMPDQVRQTELVLLHDWSMTRIPIREIDSETSRLTAVDSIGAKVLDFFTLDHWESQPRYFLENDRRFVDQDYEWFVDAEARRIYLQLPANTDIQATEIILPVAEELFVLEGTAQQPIRNIHVKGLTFRHSTWYLPSMGYGGIQATHFDPRPDTGKGWSVIPAAVVARYADSCSFVQCTFENLGGSGIWLGEGCTHNRVSQSEFVDISGNGIMIGEGRDRTVGGEAWWTRAPEQAAQNNAVDNCQVHDCGVQYFGAVGIWCGLTAGTVLTNNQVYDLPYTGISVGWMWNPSPTPARENLLSGNHIHHIMQKLSDGGGIYLLGLQPGSKLLNNRIHDVALNVGKAESNGMFLDEGTTDVEVAGNTIYHIAKSPIRFHKATTNLVRNNTLFCREGVPPFAYNNCDETLIKKVDNQVYHPGDAAHDSALKKAQKP